MDLTQWIETQAVDGLAATLAAVSKCYKSAALADKQTGKPHKLGCKSRESAHHSRNFFSHDCIQLTQHVGKFLGTLFGYIILNVSVMMTLFNEINMHKLQNQRNVFSGILGNPIFWYVIIITIIAQVILIQFGGIAFGTSSLTADQWLISVAFGAGTMVWHQIIICIPCEWMPNGEQSESTNQTSQNSDVRRSNSVHRTTSRTQTIDRVVSKTIFDTHPAAAPLKKRIVCSAPWCQFQTLLF